MAVIVRDSIPVAEMGNERQKSENDGKEKFLGSDKKKEKVAFEWKVTIYTDRCFAETDIDCLFN